WFVAFMDLFFFVTAIGGLFFADNPKVLKLVVVSVIFFQSSAAAVLGYLIPYMKFPKFSPWLGFSIIFGSGILATILAVLTVAYPFLESNGVINWNLSPSSDILRPLIFLATLLPMGIILVRQGMLLQVKEARIKAIGLGWTFLSGVITSVIESTLKSVFKLGAISSDISVLVLAISMLLLVIFTQKTPKQKWVKNVLE
ncbi:MAG: hypothetical protein Q7S60_05870, partial [bacterium]|nr:hypothetical protein [bacterium]